LQQEFQELKMAEAPSLGDFFAKKTKKKIKGSNLNKATDTPAEEPKKATKSKGGDDEGWQEEEVVQQTMKVEAAGKLVREEEKAEDQQDSAAPAWGHLKIKDNKDLNDRKFPSLAKSVQSSAINLEDTSGKVNISTSKNMFANLENDDPDEDEGPKRPKEIKPAMVTKKKGERAQDAIQREVGKYKEKKDTKAGDNEDDEDEEAEEKEKEVKPKKVAKAKVAEASKSEEPEAEEQAEDVKIVPDLAAAKAKYAHRKKLPVVELPREELEEEKENKPVQQPKGGKKKKFANIEEETDKKLQYADWDEVLSKKSPPLLLATG